MERNIEIYSEITRDVKRTHIDLIVDGKVKDREYSEGYTHAAVDEWASRYASEMAEAYGIPAPAIIDHGLMEYERFWKLAAR